MKGHTKRTLALLLCTVMLVCLLPVSVFAEGTVPHYDVYTVLGDSNPSGFGTDAYYNNAGGIKIKDGDLIEGTYPALVANAVTADKVNVYSHCAWRVNELLRVIDPEFNWDDGYSNTYFTGLGFDGRFGFDTDAYAAKIPDAIREADLITLQFGSNDIFTHAINRTTNAYPDLLDSLGIELPETVDENLLYTLLFSAAEKAGILLDVVKSFEGFLTENSEIYEANLERALHKLREMNPDADIYVVGTLNSCNQTIETDCGLFLSLPTITDARIALVNLHLKEMCRDIDNCFYVDVPKTDMFGITALDIEETLDDDGIPYTALKIVHPTEKGHAYMAKQIINVMKAYAAPAPVVTVSKSTLLKKNVLKWNDLDGACMYRVYRSTSENGDYIYIGSVMGNTFYDAIALNGIQHYYKVCAVMSYTDSILSPMSIPVRA